MMERYSELVSVFISVRVLFSCNMMKIASVIGKDYKNLFLKIIFFLFVKSFSPLIIYQRMPQNNKERENLVSKTRGNKIGIYCSTRVAFFKL